jgi:predicted alpha/beta hydrolase family esterase
VHSRVDSCVSCTVARVVLRVSHVPFSRIVSRRVRALSRDDHVCRTASARSNKLFSLISTHVSNANSSGHICQIINLRFAQLIFIRLIFQLN